MARSDSDKNLPTLVSELRALVVDYAKQETVEPLKSLGRFVAQGLKGAALLALGFILLSLAGLRALQQETSPHWTGNLTWLPYVLATIWSVLVALALAWRITVERRRSRAARRT